MSLSLPTVLKSIAATAAILVFTTVGAAYASGTAHADTPKPLQPIASTADGSVR